MAKRGWLWREGAKKGSEWEQVWAIFTPPSTLALYDSPGESADNSILRISLADCRVGKPKSIRKNRAAFRISLGPNSTASATAAAATIAAVNASSAGGKASKKSGKVAETTKLILSGETEMKTAEWETLLDKATRGEATQLAAATADDMEQRKNSRRKSSPVLGVMVSGSIYNPNNASNRNNNNNNNNNNSTDSGSDNNSGSNNAARFSQYRNANGAPAPAAAISMGIEGANESGSDIGGGGGGGGGFSVASSPAPSSSLGSTTAPSPQKSASTATAGSFEFHYLSSSANDPKSLPLRPHSMRSPARVTTTTNRMSTRMQPLVISEDLMKSVSALAGETSDNNSSYLSPSALTASEERTPPTPASPPGFSEDVFAFLVSCGLSAIDPTTKSLADRLIAEGFDCVSELKKGIPDHQQLTDMGFTKMRDRNVIIRRLEELNATDALGGSGGGGPASKSSLSRADSESDKLGSLPGAGGARRGNLFDSMLGRGESRAIAPPTKNTTIVSSPVDSINSNNSDAGNSTPMDPNGSVLLLAGWLQKEGGVTWSKRFFTLSRGGRLAWFSNPQEAIQHKTPRGAVDIVGWKVELPQSKSRSRLAFLLQKTRVRARTTASQATVAWESMGEEISGTFAPLSNNSIDDSSAGGKPGGTSSSSSSSNVRRLMLATETVEERLEWMHAIDMVARGLDDDLYPSQKVFLFLGGSSGSGSGGSSSNINLSSPSNMRSTMIGGGGNLNNSSSGYSSNSSRSTVILSPPTAAAAIAAVAAAGPGHSNPAGGGGGASGLDSPSGADSVHDMTTQEAPRIKGWLSVEGKAKNWKLRYFVCATGGLRWFESEDQMVAGLPAGYAPLLGAAVMAPKSTRVGRFAFRLCLSEASRKSKMILSAPTLDERRKWEASLRQEISWIEKQQQSVVSIGVERANEAGGVLLEGNLRFLLPREVLGASSDCEGDDGIVGVLLPEAPQVRRFVSLEVGPEEGTGVNPGARFLIYRDVSADLPVAGFMLSRVRKVGRARELMHGIRVTFEEGTSPWDGRPENDIQFVRAIQEKMGSLPVGDHKWRKTTYSGTVIAQDFVTWAVREGLAHSRDAAVSIGKRLVSSFAMYHVGLEKDFEDDTNLFKGPWTLRLMAGISGGNTCAVAANGLIFGISEMLFRAESEQEATSWENTLLRAAGCNADLSLELLASETQDQQVCRDGHLAILSTKGRNEWQTRWCELSNSSLRFSEPGVHDATLGSVPTAAIRGVLRSKATPRVLKITFVPLASGTGGKGTFAPLQQADDGNNNNNNKNDDDSLTTDGWKWEGSVLVSKVRTALREHGCVVGSHHQHHHQHQHQHQHQHHQHQSPHDPNTPGVTSPSLPLTHSPVACGDEERDPSFKGFELVDWLISVGLASNRDAAKRIGKRLVEVSALRHLHSERPFEDSKSLFVWEWEVPSETTLVLRAETESDAKEWEATLRAVLPKKDSGLRDMVSKALRRFAPDASPPPALLGGEVCVCLERTGETKVMTIQRWCEIRGSTIVWSRSSEERDRVCGGIHLACVASVALVSDMTDTVHMVIFPPPPKKLISVLQIQSPKGSDAATDSSDLPTVMQLEKEDDEDEGWLAFIPPGDHELALAMRMTVRGTMMPLIDAKKRTIAGWKLVDWFISQDICRGRDEATHFGRYLVEMFLLHTPDYSSSFADDKTEYRFIWDEEQQSSSFFGGNGGNDGAGGGNSSGHYPFQSSTSFSSLPILPPSISQQQQMQQQHQQFQAQLQQLQQQQFSPLSSIFLRFTQTSVATKWMKQIKQQRPLPKGSAVEGFTPENCTLRIREAADTTFKGGAGVVIPQDEVVDGARLAQDVESWLQISGAALSQLISSGRDDIFQVCFRTYYDCLYSAVHAALSRANRVGSWDFVNTSLLMQKISQAAKTFAEFDENHYCESKAIMSSPEVAYLITQASENLRTANLSLVDRIVTAERSAVPVMDSDGKLETALHVDIFSLLSQQISSLSRTKNRDYIFRCVQFGCLPPLVHFVEQLSLLLKDNRRDDGNGGGGGGGGNERKGGGSSDSKREKAKAIKDKKSGESSHHSKEEVEEEEEIDENGKEVHWLVAFANNGYTGVEHVETLRDQLVEMFGSDFTEQLVLGAIDQSFRDLFRQAARAISNKLLDLSACPIEDIVLPEAEGGGLSARLEPIASAIQDIEPLLKQKVMRETLVCLFQRGVFYYVVSLLSATRKHHPLLGESVLRDLNTVLVSLGKNINKEMKKQMWVVDTLLLSLGCELLELPRHLSELFNGSDMTIRTAETIARLRGDDAGVIVQACISKLNFSDPRPDAEPFFALMPFLADTPAQPQKRKIMLSRASRVSQAAAAATAASSASSMLPPDHPLKDCVPRVNATGKQTQKCVIS